MRSNISEDNQDACPEGEIRVGNVCKDLGPSSTVPPSENRDGSVVVDPPVVDGGAPGTGQTALPFFADDHFAVSGYMGDAETPGNLYDYECDAGTNAAYCHRFAITQGLIGWTGVWWQSPADNWGETEGLGLPIAPGAQKVTFKAWSDEGGEKVDFFVGYSSDGFSASKPAVTLSDEPTIYEMDIHCYDYARVAGGFGWSMETVELTQPVNVYIAEVQWTNEANANPVDCVALEEERLSLGVFYDGPASETYDIDDVVKTSLHVYEETVSITTTDQTFEGAVANTIGYNNLGWWGMGIHWDTAEDLSAWEAIHLAVKISAPNEFKT